MVKSKLLRTLNEKLPELQQRDVELAINCMLEQMIAALSKGERIEIRGFGSFNIRYHAPRIGRNPKTGETVNLPEKFAIHYKPGKEIRDRVDGARDKCRITD